MQKNKKFIPVMLMPFFEDGSIDYSSLNQLVEFYLRSGAGGLFANCLSSEMFHLSREEMLKSVSYIVQTVAGRVPVVATGTFEDTIENQAEFVKEIYQAGVDSVIIITGLLAKEFDTEGVFRDNVHSLLALTGNIPLGFYECPVPYKRIIAAEFLGELVATGRVKYHKDTSLDIINVGSKLIFTKEVPDFGLYDAYMVHAVDSLLAGSAGLSCIQGNYFPELISWLCTHYNNELKCKEIASVQEFLRINMDLMHDTYPKSAKYILSKRNLPISLHCRNRSIELEDTEKICLDNLYSDYSLLCEEIGLNIPSSLAN